MRSGVGGLALAPILLLSSLGLSGLGLSGCAKPEPGAPAAPAALSVPLAEGGHGVLAAQTNDITVKGKAGDYSQTVAITPNWWVGAGEFKIVWYAGMSQTKRFFQVSNIKGAPADRPAFLKNPEEGVRLVKVSFDGAEPMTVKPTTARAPFKFPAGAKAVTATFALPGCTVTPQLRHGFATRAVPPFSLLIVARVTVFPSQAAETRNAPAARKSRNAARPRFVAFGNSRITPA